MQLGMPTLIELKSAEACAELCCELGLGFIELSMDLPNYQAEKLIADELRRIADKYKVFYTIHLEGFLDPCVFNSRVMSAYTETVMQVIDISKQLGIPLLNMHMNRGDHFTLPDGKVALYEVYKTEYLQKLTDFRDKCTAAIGDADIKISLENCGDYGRCGYMREGLDELLQSPAFALCFDIGHNAAADYADEQTIMEREEHLCHMHIHDATGRANHLPLGEGDVDLRKYLALAEKYNCRAVLEVKTVEGLRTSVEWLKERGVVHE
ncbi:MAG: sugar phosphate isomerase/epimerase family protein [Clostridia bacterium]